MLARVQQCALVYLDDIENRPRVLAIARQGAVASYSTAPECRAEEPHDGRVLLLQVSLAAGNVACLAGLAKHRATDVADAFALAATS